MMEDGAKVKLRGVQVGEVDIHRRRDRCGRRTFQAETEDLPRALPVPAEQPRGGDQVQHRIRRQVRRSHRAAGRQTPSRLKPGAVLRSRNVTVEVNTVFQNLQGWSSPSTRPS